MPRSRPKVYAHKRHKKVLKFTKGQYGTRSKLFRRANEAMLKSLVAVAWADGRIENEETEVIEALISAFGVEGCASCVIREYAKTPKSINDVPTTELSASDRRVLLQHAVIVTYIGPLHVKLEREDGAIFQIASDPHPDHPSEFYLDKAGDIDVVGYFPSIEAAIAAAKEA